MMRDGHRVGIAPEGELSGTLSLAADSRGEDMLMDRNTILSLSLDQEALVSRETALRNEGMKVISVMSPVQARFEIEMGRCGVFLICYRLSEMAARELTQLFRSSCPEGRIIFVTKGSDDKKAPVEADIVIPESKDPELIVQFLRGSRPPRRAA